MPFCTTCGASVTGTFCTQCGTPVSAASGQASPPPAPGPAGSAPMPPPAAQTPPPIPGARRTSPLVWVLVIVLGLFVLGGLTIAGIGFFVVHKAREAGLSPEMMRRNPAAATARMLAAVNPDVQIVSQNDGEGTVTVRDRRTGKTMTWNLDQAKRGRFSITAEDDNGKRGTVEFGAGSTDKLPSWVPAYPGSNAQGTFSVTGNGDEGSGGNFAFTTSDSADKVLAFYQDKIKELGMKIQVNTTTPGGGMLTAADENDRRTLNIIVGGGNETTVNVTYADKH